MSYAEHGSRIFLTGTFNPEPLTRYGDILVQRKRSEGRLKLFDSCTDLRAWSSNVLDNCRYFREVVKNPLPRGKIVPYDVMIENLILLGVRTQRELASVRQQLERYKSLRLTTEQERQLSDSEGDTSEDPFSAKDSTSLQQSKSTDDVSPIPRRPETPIQSTSSSSTNFHDIELDGRGRSDDDDESSSDDRSEDSKEVLVYSETYPAEDADVPEKRRRNDRSLNRYRTFDSDSHQAIIIEKDSTIIALKNELGAKESELEEFRELSRRLESALSEKEAIMDNLRGNIRISQEHVLAMNDQLHQKMEEWKKRMQTSKCLIDHLKSTVAEKSHECSEQSREIEDMRERIKETDVLREERDCLGRKLDEVKAAIRERNDLAKLNREQAVNLADQEDEISRLVVLIKRTSAKHDEREIKMKSAIDDLRAKIEVKNSQLSQFEAQCAPIGREVSYATSFSEMATVEIRNMKRSLQEDLREAENELARRSDGQQRNDRFGHEEMGSRTKDTVERWNKTMARRDDWEREKEFKECTIEQLTMQVSASNATNEEQAEIHKHVVSQLCTSFEKIQRLIVELEPYCEERPSLIETINCMNDALKEAQATAESRDVITQKQYLAEVLKKHRKQCEGYEKRIAAMTNKLAELRNDRENIVEKIRRDRDSRVDESMDEKIDDALSTRVKRSSETIEKLSAALRGAGDYHDIEMAKKENELESRNAEIAKLREQVASKGSRGQGDQAEREDSCETQRLKNELKLLNSELAKTRDALQRTKEKLESSEFKLKGSNQRFKELRGQCRKQEEKVAVAEKTINRLEKENECLNKTVLSAGELQTKVDEIQLSLESLQDKNAKLVDEVAKANEICAEYKNTIIDLTNRETRATDALERAKCKFQTLVSKRASEIEAFKKENETANVELEENKLKITNLTEQIQYLKENSKKLEAMENLMSEISKIGKRINQLQNKVASRRSELEDHNRDNDKLEKDLNLKLSENECLQSGIRELNKNIERLSTMPEAVAEQLFDTLPRKICYPIETLRSQSNLSESEGQLIQSENEWRANSREDTLLVESLPHDIKLYNDKAAQQDALIVELQEANANLKKELVQIRAESASQNSTEAVSKLSSNLMNEMREKEEEIEKLNHRIKTMMEEQRSLIVEKLEISGLLKVEKDWRQAKLAELQQNYNTQIRQYRTDHNASIKRLEAQYEESFGKPFNSESWLTSLSPKEMAELHKRICTYGPCETISEASKIRALNDKQNQQLQQDEKLRSDIIHLRNGHHREPEIGSPYVYERRKFDTAKHGTAETPFTDTFDMKRMNFIYQCANQHKHDSSH